ncbi:hypothetical protein Sphch_2497 [Sphingobium chlorophenolicum L-1]|uniref:Uncharacterized protein n=1 Tax=Sphingobium chlorophenolicum L-1 TaxID=690566 RepID=F6EZ58_SPHCR|nr:hypothetical protein Sphch_2497 [Sphingobium chlorophenolicum L-1]
MDATSMVRFEQYGRRLSAGPDLSRIGCGRPGLVARRHRENSSYSPSRLRTGHSPTANHAREGVSGPIQDRPSLCHQAGDFMISRGACRNWCGKASGNVQEKFRFLPFLFTVINPSRSAIYLSSPFFATLCSLTPSADRAARGSALTPTARRRGCRVRTAPSAGSSPATRNGPPDSPAPPPARRPRSP